MMDYAAQIPPQDRWAIAAYVRALQLSQRTTIADVPPEARAPLESPEARGRPVPFPTDTDDWTGSVEPMPTPSGERKEH